MLHKREHYEAGAGMHVHYGPLELRTHYDEPANVLSEHDELMEAIEGLDDAPIEIVRDGQVVAKLIPPGWLED